jgi:biotin carboxylase
VSTQRSAAGAKRLAYIYHPRSFGTFALADAAKGICELIWVVDTSDPETAVMARLLRRLGEVVDVTGASPQEAAAAVAEARPDGILALNDEILLSTAELAARVGLPFLDPVVARRLTDKQEQRAALRSGGIPVPDFRPVPADDDGPGWDALEREATFPAMLKPRQSEGSKHVVRVDSMQELRASLAEVPQDARSSLMLEGYLADRERIPDGFADYVSVESIVSDGRISHLAVNGRFPTAEPFRETGFFIPSAYDEADTAAVLEAATAAVGAIGVERGALHSEIKMTPDGPRVIELNGRPGGGVSEMLEDLTGDSLLTMTMRLALGEQIVVEEMPRPSQVAFLFYVQAPAWMTAVRDVRGVDVLRALPGVSEVTINRGAGADVSWRAGNHGHVVSVQGVVPDHVGVLAIANSIAAELRIEGD